MTFVGFNWEVQINPNYIANYILKNTMDGIVKTNNLGFQKKDRASWS